MSLLGSNFNMHAVFYQADFTLTCATGVRERQAHTYCIPYLTLRGDVHARGAEHEKATERTSPHLADKSVPAAAGTKILILKPASVIKKYSRLRLH